MRPAPAPIWPLLWSLSPPLSLLLGEEASETVIFSHNTFNTPLWRFGEKRWTVSWLPQWLIKQRDRLWSCRSQQSHYDHHHHHQVFIITVWTKKTTTTKQNLCPDHKNQRSLNLSCNNSLTNVSNSCHVLLSLIMSIYSMYVLCSSPLFWWIDNWIFLCGFKYLFQGIFLTCQVLIDLV